MVVMYCSKLRKAAAAVVERKPKKEAKVTTLHRLVTAVPILIIKLLS
jgi:hypothetical protein